MAGQLLPLLLLGGGAAVVATKAKKGRKKKCPPEVRVTMGELNSATTRAQLKFKDGSSAFKEAEFFVSSIMPKGCGPSSFNTRIKATFEVKKLGKSVDVDLSATDVYMLALGQALGRNVAGGKTTQEKAEKDWHEALGWYKKTTGKNFDITSLGLEIFEDLGGLLDDLAQGLGMGNGKGGKDKKVDGCPAEYEFDVTKDINEKVQHLWEIGRAKYPMNPFKIADGMFASLVLPGCTKESSESVLKINVAPDARPLGNHMTGYMGLPTFYAHLVANCIEGILEEGDGGPIKTMDDAKAFVGGNMSELQSWHMKVTGSPLPPEWDSVMFLKMLEEGLI